jgi:signal-transduction protein with cAMP-binding, CBS, and nucleotidyltransferase domain
MVSVAQSKWQNTFDKWIYHGAPLDLLHSTIFFDFRPLFGAEKHGRRIARMAR